MNSHDESTGTRPRPRDPTPHETHRHAQRRQIQHGLRGKRMNLNRTVRSCPRSAMKPDSFNSASPVIRTRTTPITLHVFQHRATMALCAAMRWPDNACALRFNSAVDPTGTARWSLFTTASSRQSNQQHERHGPSLNPKDDVRVPGPQRSARRQRGGIDARDETPRLMR